MKRICAKMYTCSKSGGIRKWNIKSGKNQKVPYQSVVLFALIIFFLAGSTAKINAQEKVNHHTKANEYLSSRGEVYFSFDFDAGQAHKNLIDSILSVDQVDFSQIFAYANRKGFDSFLKLNIPFRVHTPPSLLLKDSELKSSSFQNWDFYPSLSAYHEMMQEFAFLYPDLCRLDTMGWSELGRPILYLTISSDWRKEKPLPGVYLTSSMHGDETVGYILLLRLADYLLNQYNIDDRITYLIDETHIYLNPLANPDGAYASSESSVLGATRFNANQIDLNRNFPDPSYGNHPDGNPWQAENLAQMDMHQKNLIHLSANIHTGAEVLNYPWDTWSHWHADNDFFVFLSREYVDTVHANLPSGWGTYLSDLNNGITHGYAWYYITGSRQDFVTYYTGGREITMELSKVKMPGAYLLPSFWEANYLSLINYIARAQYGLRGIVRDMDTQKPLRAKVSIPNFDFEKSYVFSDSIKGSFFRYPAPGNYQVLIESPGYNPQLIPISILDYYSSVELIIEMEPILSVSDSEKNQILIYPNPFDGNLQFELSIDLNGTNFELYNLQGKMLGVYQILSGETIEMSFLPPGVYFVKSTENQSVVRLLKR